MKHIDWFEHISPASFIVVFTLCCAVAVPSLASASTDYPGGSTKGLSLGGHAAVIGVNSDSVDLNGQASNPAGVTVTGGGLTVAYGLNEWLTIGLAGDGCETGNGRHFVFADIGAQVFLPRARRLRPHLDVALTGRRAEFNAAGDLIDARGAGVSVGGGALYSASRSLALDTALLWTAGGLRRFADGERAKDLDPIGVSETRFLVGVRWFVGR